ncbi:lipoprotein-releasing system transmembrane subunit, LolC/LolE family [Aliidiomarina shirensis]|uniref:Lipoprotein-releasing system transmembrane subunit, LolC/LolE family n=1 Tax=Aliidiomarina shirensis TaxID=1048642 RepID=A0A432WWM2_9GAMM|nr:lipoprotein-releasing ABC transporter permease subunit [Aliidiomarina shirensis]RUO38163.1 lipoprotein-releasing system transmembrane subunit, LolC/LolE family [Aliidiomarina shirensis]
MNLPFLLARRFRKSREKTRYLSFISASSTIGIGLACAILIILLSVMNGFQKALETDFLSMVPHVEYQAAQGGLQDWREIVRVAEQHPGVKAAAPAIKLSAMVQEPGRFRGIQLRAIDTNLEPAVSGITRYLPAAAWQDFIENPDGILLGKGLADALQLRVGDRINLIIPQLQQGNALSAPQRINAEVVGIFAMGGELDFQQAYIHLAAGQKAARIDTEAASVRLALHNVYAAPAVAREVASEVREYAFIHDWTRTEGHLYRDIQLVRTIMYLVLVLVLAVASFNIVSTLIMVVREKQSSIAILRTMGASPKLIVATFVYQGSLNGVIGALFGSLIGTIAAALLPDLLGWLEQALSFSLLPAELYFISSIPSDVLVRDVVLVTGVAIATSVLATLYPAWQAAKLTPVQALRGQ